MVKLSLIKRKKENMYTNEEDEERRDSWLVAYKQKEERLAMEGESENAPLLWSLLLLAHSTPGSIPAILDSLFCMFELIEQRTMKCLSLLQAKEFF